ncbi:MAG: DMT family transporter [Actinobacteria bacterium]|nr:DMT family transporter [Actinomycetota bacterium]
MRRYLVLAAVCSCWGTIPLVASHVDLPAPAIVLVRVWVAAAALGLVLAGSRLVGTGVGSTGWRGAGSRTSPARPLVAGLLLAVHWTTMFAGYQHAPDDTVVFIIFLAPVGVALLAPRALGEAVGSRTIVALTLAVGGFALVAGPSIRAAGAAGVGLAALSSAAFVALVLVSKPLAVVYGGLRLTLVEMVVAGLVLLPVASTVDWGSARRFWPWLAILGLVHTGLFVTLYLWALARVPASHAGILGYLEPAGVVVVSWWLLAAPPRLTTVLGGLLIVAAGALVVLSGDQAEQREPRASKEVPAGVPG